jgi:hypothetical protein
MNWWSLTPGRIFSLPIAHPTFLALTKDQQEALQVVLTRSRLHPAMFRKLFGGIRQ